MPPADRVTRARARLLLTLAFSQLELEGEAGSRDAVEDALRAAERSGTLDVVALVHDLRGLVRLRAGDLPGALSELDRAVALAGHLPDREQGSVYLNRGTVQLFRRDLVAARGDLARSIALAAATGDGQVEFKARHNLGYAEFLAGDLPRALETMARADLLDVPVSRSVWLLDRARVLMEAGLLVDARTALTTATTLLRTERAGQDLAETELERAQLALLQGDPQAASAHARRARRAFVRRGSTGWAARADLTRWQAVLDTPAGAHQVVREVGAVLAPRVGASPAPADLPLEPRAVLLAAQAHLRVGRVAEAAGLLTLDGHAAPRRDDPLTAHLHHHLVRAEVARAALDPVAARRALRAGLATLTRAQARHHSLDLRTAMTVHGQRLAELDLRLAVESGRATAVFESLERWRAMSHRRSAVRPPDDPVLADLLTQLRTVTEDLRSARPGAPVDPLRRRRRRLEQAVREREWQLSGDGRTRRETRWREARTALVASGTDLLAHVVLDGRLHAVVVRDGRARVEALGPWAQVEALVTRVQADLDALSGPHLPGALRSAVAASLRRDLERLDAAVLPERVAAATRLVVVPTRTLATVPWGLLPRRRRRATTVALSATSWVRGVGAHDAASPGGALRVTALAGPAVPLAPDEVHAVTRTWVPTGADATAVLPLDADAPTLAAALVRSDVVHIAAHGTHNHDNPLFSSIRLTGGPLFAYDVPQDAGLAQHVVLSACDLGLATPRPGGEVLGLTAALLGLGTRCVVSAVSRVGDATAHATMLRYHRALAVGVEAADALAGAVDDDGGLEHPAPFVCFGSSWAAPPGVASPGDDPR